MNSLNKSPHCQRHTWLSLARKSLMPCGNQQGAELPFELLLGKEIRGHVRVSSKLHKKSRGCVWLVIYNSQT